MTTKKKTDNTVAQRGERYSTKQEDRGLVRVHPWVPKNRRKELLEFAQELRKEEVANAAA